VPIVLILIALLGLIYEVSRQAM